MLISVAVPVAVMVPVAVLLLREPRRHVAIAPSALLPVVPAGGPVIIVAIVSAVVTLVMVLCAVFRAAIVVAIVVAVPGTWIMRHC